MLLDVIADIPDDIPVLLDAKRGDIGETSAAYARAVFDTLGAQVKSLNYGRRRASRRRTARAGFPNRGQRR